MFDTIILLTGVVEQPVFADLLCRHNPQLTVRPVSTPMEIDALEPQLLRRARLLGFTTPVVVPPRILDALGYGAYNFHPGPPHYPGWAPAHFAIYDRARCFGATAHVMVERVDAGPIVACKMFAVPPDATVFRLECLAYSALARLFWELAKALATQSEPLPPIDVTWSGRKTSRRIYAGMCDIPLDITREELGRRVRAFRARDFGLGHTITLHGYKFRLVAEDDAPSPEPAAAHGRLIA